jgi:hypothetical protein
MGGRGVCRYPLALLRLKPFSVLLLPLEGGPNDGETRLLAGVRSVRPPERLRPSVGDAGAYVRQPELPAPWTWRHRWEPVD